MLIVYLQIHLSWDNKSNRNGSTDESSDNFRYVKT